MASVMYDTFWSEWFWLPPNVTWTDFERKTPPGEEYSHAKELYMPFVVAFGLLICRYFFEKLIGAPIARWYGLKDKKPTPPVHNDVLEKAYNQKKSPKHETVQALAKQTDLSVRQVEWWFRRRQAQGRPTALKKFTETAWRFAYYCPIFYYGLYILWDKPWLWDTKQCWINYPQTMSSSIYWYYMIELGFYWSLVFSLMTDNKRKDFWEMVIHHIATIGLMTFSWTGGMWRVGTLVLVIHDACDYWMEAAKMAKYVKYQNLCNVFFGIFAIGWLLTRLIYYPATVLKSTILEASEIRSPWPMHILTNLLLLVLQVLHVIWFAMIMGIAYTAIVVGQVERDNRSETDEPLSSDDEGANMPDKED